MRESVLFGLLCAALIWVAVKAEQKLTAPSRNWASQMANYCKDLADSFKRLERQF